MPECDSVAGGSHVGDVNAAKGEADQNVSTPPGQKSESGLPQQPIQSQLCAMPIAATSPVRAIPLPGRASPDRMRPRPAAASGPSPRPRTGLSRFEGQERDEGSDDWDEGFHLRLLVSRLAWMDGPLLARLRFFSRAGRPDPRS